MSEFGDSEASEASELSEEERVPRNRVGGLSDDESENSEDDEIPNEDELCREELGGFIVDDDKEEDSEPEVNAKDSEEDEDLDEDDFALIQENKKRRIVLDDDDDDEAIDIKKSRGREYDREQIAKKLFHSDDEAESEAGHMRTYETQKRVDFDVSEVDDEMAEEELQDDMDDFIVPDGPPGADGQPVPMRQKRTFVHKDAALQEAQMVFGVDFEQADFEKLAEEAEYDEDKEYLSEEENEDEYDSEEEDVERAAMRRVKRLPKHVLDRKVHELFDPSDLERAYFSQSDERIRSVDLPERFQLRKVPVKQLEDPPTSGELQELSVEAEWIYTNAFKDDSKKEATVKSCVLQCLKLMHEGYEVPFIAFYRKESMEPHLNIFDLWKIYDYDEKWTSIQRSKASIIKVLQNLMDYFDYIIAQPIEDVEPDSEEANKRVTAKSNAERLKHSVIKLIAQCRSAESYEDVADIRMYYLLHFTNYSASVKKWEELVHKKSSDSKDPESKDSNEAEEETEDALDLDEISKEKKTLERSLITMTIDPQSGRSIKQRRARTTAAYELASRANISELVKRFGLSASQFAQNVNDQYVRYEVDQCPMLPMDAAKDFECPQFSTAESCLKAARYMLAFEISREPMVRKMCRQMLQDHCVLNVKATKKGMSEIEESHPLYPMKFIKDKPFKEFKGDILYLHLHNGAKDGLVEFSLRQYEIKGCTLLDELCRFFHQDEFSTLVQAWNEQRLLVLKEALDAFLLPQLLKEMQEKLLEASHQSLAKVCAHKMFNYLQVAPYIAGAKDANDEVFGSSTADDDYHSRGKLNRNNDLARVWPLPARTIALAMSEMDESHPALLSAVALDANGEVIDYIHAPGLILVDRKGLNEELLSQKEKDCDRILAFIQRNDPQVLVVGCDSRKSLKIRDHLQIYCDHLFNEHRLTTHARVELMDTCLANVYARCKCATSDLPASYTYLLKVAISLGRRLQDPLAEFCQLMNYDQEMLGFRFHPLQDSLPKDILWRTLEIECINRVNEVGVDINRALDHPHTANLVQFVSGFGPRKALHVLKTLKQKKVRLTNRVHLVTVLKLGPHVVINCAGFIRIDTTNIRADLDSDEIELLDSTRVHPESYELAKKMAVDALEYEDEEDARNDESSDEYDSDSDGGRVRRKKGHKEPDQVAALEEIVQTPSRLRELDLDAFAEELKRQGHGDKHVTLYDIRREFNNRYCDLRSPFKPPNDEQIFIWVTNETPDTLHVGSIVQCKCINIVTKRPRPEQLDNANPQKSDETGKWMCPFCRQNDFMLLNHVWTHFDSNECIGQPVGLKVELDNNIISGFVPLKLTDLSGRGNRDDEAFSVFTRYPTGCLLQARVVKIDITKFSVDLNCKENALKHDRNMFKVQKDRFYDYDVEEEMQKKIEDDAQKEAEEKAKKQPYLNRVIFHPNFKNISYKQLISIEPHLENGEVIIRPSSKGVDHLTLSWKVDAGIMKHIDIFEKDKTTPYALGKQLVISNESYDDLDEIIARYVQPMSILLHEISSFKYYRDSKGGSADILTEILRKDKEECPERIPYFFSSVKKYPGKFVLAFMPNQRPHFEYVGILPEGFKFRNMLFPTLDRLLAWFKVHYNDASTITSHSRQHNTPSQHRSNEALRSSSGIPGNDDTRKTYKSENYKQFVENRVVNQSPMYASYNQNSTASAAAAINDVKANIVKSMTMNPAPRRTPNTYAQLAKQYAEASMGQKISDD